MADKQAVAKKWYKAMCKMLDKRGWTYDKEEDKNKISCKVSGDNGTLDVRMYLDAERELAITWVFVDLKVPEEMRETMAHAVNVVNYCLIHGAFDFGQEKGNLLYRCTSSYRDSVVSDEWFNYLLGVSVSSADMYVEKLRRVVKGYLTVDELYEELRK